MPSYKKELAQFKKENRTSSDGLPYCRGLAPANAKFVLGRLQDLTANEANVVRTFVRNFEASLTERFADPYSCTNCGSLVPSINMYGYCAECAAGIDAEGPRKL